MEWPIYAGVTFAISLLWLLCALIAGTLPQLQNKRITLLIAHPDDEAMFFAPTVLGLTRAEARNHVNILCLSSGNAEGLGRIRTEELTKSASLLGVKSASDVKVIEDDQQFPDSMTTTWPSAEIIALLDQHIEDTKTDTIITFDQHGVSSHPNHKSLHNAVVRLLQQDRHRRHLTVYALTSVNMLRKYGSILDAPFTILQVLCGILMSSSGSASGPPNRLIHVSGAREYAQARRAMTQAHKSQMVWFRYGWIGLSRYMVVNDLRLVGVGDSN